VGRGEIEVIFYFTLFSKLLSLWNFYLST